MLYIANSYIQWSSRSNFCDCGRLNACLISVIAIFAGICQVNQTDVDTSLGLKADLSALNTPNAILTTKANITDMNYKRTLEKDLRELLRM